MQDMLQIGGQNFTVTAPDPYTVVINTGKPHAALLDALCPGDLPIMPKHMLGEAYKNGTFASAYNVSTPPEKIVTSGAWRLAPARDEREDRAGPQPVPLRVRSEQAAAAVPRTSSSFSSCPIRMRPI